MQHFYGVVKMINMRCAYSMGRLVKDLTVFFYLKEMVSVYPSKSNNVPYLENAAVKWFHMRCAYSMGRPV